MDLQVTRPSLELLELAVQALSQYDIELVVKAPDGNGHDFPMSSLHQAPARCRLVEFTGHLTREQIIKLPVGHLRWLHLYITVCNLDVVGPHLPHLQHIPRKYPLSKYSIGRVGCQPLVHE